jgi:hypothetical protein
MSRGVLTSLLRQEEQQMHDECATLHHLGLRIEELRESIDGRSARIAVLEDLVTMYPEEETTAKAEPEVAYDDYVFPSEESSASPAPPAPAAKPLREAVREWMDANDWKAEGAQARCVRELGAAKSSIFTHWSAYKAELNVGAPLVALAAPAPDVAPPSAEAPAPRPEPAPAPKVLPPRVGEWQARIIAGQLPETLGQCLAAAGEWGEKARGELAGVLGVSVKTPAGETFANRKQAEMAHKLLRQMARRGEVKP